MPLHIHFSAADLARVTLATEPDPLWEVLLSLHVLQSPAVEPRHERWRAGLTLSPAMRGLFDLAPPRGYSPDFLTPAESAAGLESGLAALRRTPRHRLRTELARLAGRAMPSRWAARLASGDHTALTDLTRGLADYHRTAVEPSWTRIEHHVRDDAAARTRILVSRGTGGLLGSLHPALTWRGDSLELDGDHLARDLRLGGRGLRLLPSFFCHGRPTVLADPALPPVLVFPATTRPAPVTCPATVSGTDAKRLEDLLGPTRAGTLRAVGDGCTTTELGRRAGVTVSVASYHASILRSAGLITTERAGPAVRHRLTRLGADLLGHRFPA
ncbi:ArsR/SmtB family transcription factor [Amycolatopsis keratiniphila]|uniref:Putative ArsR family transcriptional regulator n=1 Tax=Amycolatopsis keratiniphila TaxID=129921 RepID=R4T5E8_9PSEU|nr:winged helix-turn-helix domain-containing protein [Amycolatopsis keratiniphila]AGM06242.1 putative ArsR family transcriptional regulator [Amycolatopsis keratiniphila]